MRISKQTKKTTLAQQGRYLLICLLSMLLLFLAGSMIILNRTQQQVYEQLELAAGLSGFEIAGLRDRRTGKEYYRNDDGVHERKQEEET